MSKDDAGKGGYGRAPSDNRFKPGRSSNPSGRPKGARSLRSDFHKVLKKRVRIREGGKSRYARRQEVILLKLRAKALQGHPKAASQLLAMWAKREFRDTPPTHLNVATNNDRAIIEDFLRRNREAAWASMGTTSTEDETAVNASNNDMTGVADDDEKGANQ
jgi:uncharacterized protein DUF5681